MFGKRCDKKKIERFCGSGQVDLTTRTGRKHSKKEKGLEWLEKVEETLFISKDIEIILNKTF